MEIMRRVVVFDAADLDTESTFWAGMLGGRVLGDDQFHCVFDSHDRWGSASNSRPGTSLLSGLMGPAASPPRSPHRGSGAGPPRRGRTRRAFAARSC